MFKKIPAKKYLHKLYIIVRGQMESCFIFVDGDTVPEVCSVMFTANMYRTMVLLKEKQVALSDTILKCYCSSRR